MPVSQASDKPSDPRGTYAKMHQSFRWSVPLHFNIAEVCCGRWAASRIASKNIAVHAYSTGSSGTFHSYAELQKQANCLSNLLRAHGVRVGDRVALVMSQSFETAVAYIAVLQMGAVAVPLSILFGPEALAFRVADSEAVFAICDAVAVPALRAALGDCPNLHGLLPVGPGAERDWAAEIATASPDFTPVQTLADDPAVLIYTSGTTGNPKGALIAHRTLIGNLPGFVASQNWFGFDGKHNAGSDAVFWSPADWAWTGGLMDALLPTLYFGRPIVACRERFSAQLALELMRDYGVTHTFLFPTALKAMMKAYPGNSRQTVRRQFKLKLQAIMSAGEAVGDAVFGYCEKQLGVAPNEMFGQTEINYIVGNCALEAEALKRRALPPGTGWPAKPGSMGMGYPGHWVQVIDDEGHECPAGVAGDVALNRFDVHGAPNPIVFLGYWKNPIATAAKFTGDWCRTGDMAVRDAEGYLWYQGRSDDVFKSAGYRIGPGEIENCLVKHPAVLNAAVVPKPDQERGALVKAYVVIAPDLIAAHAMKSRARGQFESELRDALQEHVKGRLAPYEYPKEIEFVEALPMTTNGKVQRRVLRLQEEARAAGTAE